MCPAYWILMDVSSWIYYEQQGLHIISQFSMAFDCITTCVGLHYTRTHAHTYARTHAHTLMELMCEYRVYLWTIDRRAQRGGSERNVLLLISPIQTNQSVMTSVITASYLDIVSVLWYQCMHVVAKHRHWPTIIVSHVVGHVTQP